MLWPKLSPNLVLLLVAVLWTIVKGSESHVLLQKVCYPHHCQAMLTVLPDSDAENKPSVAGCEGCYLLLLATTQPALHRHHCTTQHPVFYQAPSLVRQVYG